MSAHGPAVNDAESPLAWLRRRRGPGGVPLLTATQFEAGERLRRDYTLAGLMPRLGVDLTRPPAPRRQGGAGNSVADTLDRAIAARQRVNAALGAAGPQLGSVLVDICCELVGIEEVERRRRWPRRSGKVVLGIALDRLADHYGLSEEAQGPARGGRIRHWGAADYRPRTAQ